MNLHKPISFLIILTMTGFLLAACGNNTSYISDQRGKSIAVTSSDSDTFTFKLSTEQIEELETPSVEISDETTPEEAEPTTTTVESESLEEEVPEEPLATEGPKTGEP